MSAKEELIEKIKQIGPWFHNVQVADGIFTREINPSSGPQPINHPLDRWQALEPHLPESMEGLNVLDVGSADGFFSVEFAKRGANVLATDFWKQMVDRVDFLADVMKLPISTKVCSAEDMELEGDFDMIFNLGLLYHSRHPFLLLENLQKVSHQVMFLETTITDGEDPFLYFKPPQEGVHHIPKWFPTKQCVIDMLKFVGYSKIDVFDYDTPERLLLRAEK